MKKAIGIILLVFISFNLSGQSAVEITILAKDLIAQKKYESAYKELDKADPFNKIPDIVLLKEELLLNYYITTNMHLQFGLKDLDIKENIYELRKTKGEYKPYQFNAEKIFNDLILANPENCMLYKGLADYYFQGSQLFKSSWIKSGDELKKLLETNYKNAIDKSCGDYNSYLYMGINAYDKKDYRMSTSYLFQSIDLNNDQADAHFYIADAFLRLHENDLALKYYKYSLELFKDSLKESAIADSIGNIYRNANSADSAIYYYEISNSKNPGQLYNLVALLDLYQKTNNKKYDKVARDIFDINPLELTNYFIIESTYYSNLKEIELIEFYKQQLVRFKSNNKVKVLINLSLGKMYLGRDSKLAKQYFLTAQELCKKEYTADSPTMRIIQSGIEKSEMK
jgi:hypothetical protein